MIKIALIFRVIMTFGKFPKVLKATLIGFSHTLKEFWRLITSSFLLNIMVLVAFVLFRKLQVLLKTSWKTKP